MTIRAPSAPHLEKPEPVRPPEPRIARRSSLVWKFVFFFGSIRWALILLFVIAAGVGFATFMESRFDQGVAAYYIYNALWFKAWLLLLCVNLACAAFTRWPWKKRHVGFVITHAGIITLLIGSELGQIFGFEAFVDLDKTKSPATALISKDELIKVQTAEGYEIQKPFNLQFADITPDRPLIIPAPKSAYNVVIDSTSTRLTVAQTLQPASDPLAPAGISLRLQNQAMNQDLQTQLFAKDGQDKYDFFGLATLALVDKLPDFTPKPPPRNETPFHETHMVFAMHPGEEVIDSDADAKSGNTFAILWKKNKAGKNADSVGRDGLVLETYGADHKTLSSSPLTLSKSWLPLPGTASSAKLLYRVAAYWPDFYMNGAVPGNASKKPNNPAALIQLMGPTRDLPESLAPPAVNPANTPEAKAKLDLYLAQIDTSDQKAEIAYESVRNGVVTSQGTIKPGEVIKPGWSTWQIKLEGSFAHAQSVPQIKEVPAEAGSGAIAATPNAATGLLPGLRCHLASAATGARETPDAWIVAGSSEELATTDDLVRVGYGETAIPLPFSITLEDFQVPRDEGTEIPADYISSLRFEAMDTGRIVRGTAHMNEPAMYPGEFWRSLLGWNYKFSQANWNPDNLNETTLQVLYDPGWPLKWIGSIGICLGIATMFYFWPNRNVPRVSLSEE